MVRQSFWVGIVIAVFVLGIGVSYAVFSTTYDPVNMKFRNQESFDKMISQNPKMSSQWMDAKDEKSTSMESGEPFGQGLNKRIQSRDHVGLVIQDPQLEEEIQGIFENNVYGEKEIISSSKSSDGSITVTIKSSQPEPGKFLELVELFYDDKGNIVEHVNHGIQVTQDGDTVLKMSDLHSHIGEVTYYTRMLASDSPVKVEITIFGIGMEEPLAGPINDLVVVNIAK